MQKSLKKKTKALIYFSTLILMVSTKNEFNNMQTITLVFGE